LYNWLHPVKKETPDWVIRLQADRKEFQSLDDNYPDRLESEEAYGRAMESCLDIPSASREEADTFDNMCRNVRPFGTLRVV